VDRTDASAGKESGDSMPGHWHIDGDGVALFDSHALENVGNAANFAEKLSIGDFAALTRLIALVDDCGLFNRQVRDRALRRSGGRGGSWDVSD